GADAAGPGPRAVSASLLGGGDVGLRVDAERVAQRDVVEAARGPVVVDREAEVVGLARGERDVALAAGELAREHDGPGVAVLLAVGGDERGAALHHARLGDVAVGRLPLHLPLDDVVVLAAVDARARD